jgi:CcmD family protein
VSEAGWLAVAFAAVAAGIGGYLASIALRRRRLQARLSDAARRRGG